MIFGMRRQALLLDLGDGLEDADDQADDEADEQQRAGDLQASVIACAARLTTVSWFIAPPQWKLGRAIG